MRSTIGNAVVFMKVSSLNTWCDINSSAFSAKLLYGDCHSTPPAISQHCIMQWLGAARQPAITRANFDRDLCPHMTPLSFNYSIKHSFRFVGLQRVHISFVDWITSYKMFVKTLPNIAAFWVLKSKYCHKSDAQGHSPGDSLRWICMIGWGDKAFEIPRLSLREASWQRHMYIRSPAFCEQKCHYICDMGSQCLKVLTFSTNFGPRSFS